MELCYNDITQLYAYVGHMHMEYAFWHVYFVFNELFLAVKLYDAVVLAAPLSQVCEYIWLLRL